LIDLSSNRCVIDGELIEKDDLRFTPAGIPRITLKVRHISTQTEAGLERQVCCVVPMLALGEVAQQISQFELGQQVNVVGFLAQRSLRIAQLILHVDNIKLK
jgi:primosomal replication protein N